MLTFRQKTLVGMNEKSINKKIIECQNVQHLKKKVMKIVESLNRKYTTLNER